MKVKQYIYHWLFFPLLVLLLAGGATSCSNDPAMEEEATYGKTSLVVTVRSITTTPDNATTYYDEYVKTLRIIGFDASGNLVCNGFFNSLEQVTHDTSIEITQELQNFQGGTCKLYFIANENYYTTINNTSLTDFFADENSVLTEQNLKDCIINASSTNDSWGTNPILMTAQTSAYIQSGKTEQNIGKIELFRCVAKVQLQIVNETEDDASITGSPTLSGSYPDSYSLLDVGTYTSWTREEDYYSVNLTMTLNGSTYTSQEIYFPERLLAQNIEANALKFSFTLNNKSYTAAVADETGTDFNIRRNTHYTVVATLKKKETVTFNVMVNAWGGKTMNVPAFE